MSINVQVVNDTATPEMKAMLARVTPQKIAAEVGPRATRLVQKHFLGLGPNKMGWPTTHFWGRAAQATNWQEGFGFVMVGVNQIGVRQRFYGGKIRPVKSKALTIPNVPEAYGKSAREFNNLQFGFALNPKTGKVMPALVEKKGVVKLKLGRKKKDGTRTATPVSSSTGLVAIYWLSFGVNQKPDPGVLPDDAAFHKMMDQSVDAVLRRAGRETQEESNA